LTPLTSAMAYLHTTPNLGVQYGRKNGPDGLETIYSALKDELEALSDSDWSTGYSISGFVLFLAGAALLWASKKQPVTSLSSAEAEYYAASASVTEKGSRWRKRMEASGECFWNYEHGLLAGSLFVFKAS